MRGILKNTVFNAISLYILSQLVAGVRINGGIGTLLFSGFVLSFLYIVLKPILNIFSLPLNMITLGLFSFLTNAILLYVLTVFVPNVSVSAFTFNGWTYAGFIIPRIEFNTLLAYIVSAAVLALIKNFFDWLIQK
jgi:putative membrane protein